MRRDRGKPVERVRDEHPTSAEWRADAMAASRHSRLLDELRLPQPTADPEAAASLCAEVCRNALRDLAPALILLPPAERRRAQALAAYALVLFDFARQGGLEGERLAQINRWQFHLEEALSGEAATQPIFLCLQSEEEHRPWNREALDDLADAARRRVAARRPATAEARATETERLANALVGSLEAGGDAAVELTAALLRLFSLLDLGEGLRRHDARLPQSELPEGWEERGRVASAILAEAVEREIERAHGGLARTRFDSLPKGWRKAARFAALAGRTLLRRVEKAGPTVAAHPPRLGIGTRLRLLLQARLA